MLRRNIVIIMAVVLFLGLFLQMFRTDYLFRVVSKNTNNNIDLSVKVAGESTNYKPASNEKPITRKILVLTEPANPESAAIVSNMKQVFRYLKMTYTVKDISKDAYNYNEYWLVIVTTHKLDLVPDIDKLSKYAYNGGRVFLAVNQDVGDAYYRVYRKLGVLEFGFPKIYMGVEVKDNILIKGTGLTVDGELIENFGLPVSLDKKCRVHVVSKDQNPIVWSVDYGKGRFLVNNGTMFTRNDCRGLIVGGMSLIDDDFIYPVFNIKLVYIDDFPAPFPQGYNERIKKEYSRNIEGFFRDIWWPDIVKSSFQYNLKYTGLIIETYNNLVNPPFDGPRRGENKNLIIYGRELINSGGEIGFHGYNHQPLAETGYAKENDGYNPWQSETDMEAAIKELSAYANTVFPFYDFQVYVPPSNILSPKGRKSLLKAAPSIKILSSVYYKDATDDQYDQEFGVSKDGIIELPRISSGYSDTQSSMWNEYNTITSLGTFSHFIHPDDVLDSARNGDKSWEYLYSEYNKLMSDINQNFGWLRAMTASKGGYEVKKSVESKFEFYATETGIKGYCDKAVKEGSFIMRSTKDINSKSNCTVSRIDTGVYLIEASDCIFEISITGQGK
jgi:hypothetical protein